MATGGDRPDKVSFLEISYALTASAMASRMW
jgi:hypothetical protein